MENLDFWQTTISAIISAVFTILGLFKNKKGGRQ